MSLTRKFGRVAKQAKVFRNFKAWWSVFRTKQLHRGRGLWDANRVFAGPRSYALSLKRFLETIFLTLFTRHSLFTYPPTTRHSHVTHSSLNSSLKSHSLVTQSSLTSHSFVLQLSLTGHSLHSLVTYQSFIDHSLFTYPSFIGHSLFTYQSFTGHSLITQVQWFQDCCWQLYSTRLCPFSSQSCQLYSTPPTILIIRSFFTLVSLTFMEYSCLSTCLVGLIILVYAMLILVVTSRDLLYPIHRLIRLTLNIWNL